MDNQVLTFIPKHKLECQKNYDEYIEHCRAKLTIFDNAYDKKDKNSGTGWDCNKWSWKTKRGKNLTLVFGITKSRSKYTPFKQPFNAFAKAYCRYYMSVNYQEGINWASGLRWIYPVIERHARANGSDAVDIMSLNNTMVKEIVADLKNSPLGVGTKAAAEVSIRAILTFLKDKQFKLDLADWDREIKSVGSSSTRLDKESRKEEEDKCPSDYQMIQVASAFHKAETKRQKFYSSILVMLMVHPARSAELRGLSVHSLQKSEKGRWYLMWYPVKGGKPLKKWISKPMEDVVQQAFKRLVEISEPARKAAKFAHDNPGVFMQHENCLTPENFPQDKPLTYNQYASAMGQAMGKNKHGKQYNWIGQARSGWLWKLISSLNNVADWKNDLAGYNTIGPDDNTVWPKLNGKYKPEHPTDINIVFPSFKDLHNRVNELYIDENFPKIGEINIWDCITLTRDEEFHKGYSSHKGFSWVPVSNSMLRRAIIPQELSETIFEELGITDEDGSPLALRPHQPRHWLNTKLQEAGADEWLIAKWSGRADERQNKAYDGRTTEQKTRLVKRLGSVVNKNNGLTVSGVNTILEPHTKEHPPQPIVLHDLGLPVSLKSLGVDRDGVAQFSGLGYCVHNYASSPCLKSGECATCSEHVCMKGIGNSLEELKNLESLYSEQLSEAKKNADSEVFGADRWVTSLSFRLAKIRAIIKIMEDPKYDDGTLVQIPDELDPSPVKRTMSNPDEMIQMFDMTQLALTEFKD